MSDRTVTGSIASFLDAAVNHNWG